MLTFYFNCSVSLDHIVVVLFEQLWAMTFAVIQAMIQVQNDSGKLC